MASREDMERILFEAYLKMYAVRNFEVIDKAEGLERLAKRAGFGKEKLFEIAYRAEKQVNDGE